MSLAGTRWAETLLAEQDHLAAAHPLLCRLARTLAEGNLAEPADLATLGISPTVTRGQLQ